MKIKGTMAEVYHGKAEFVSRKGGQTASDLGKNRHGSIVNKAKSEAAKISYAKNTAFKAYQEDKAGMAKLRAMRKGSA